MKSLEVGVGGGTNEPLLGAVVGGWALRVGASVADVSGAVRGGADALDFGDPGSELDFSDSESDPAFFWLAAGAPSLFKMFLISMHSLRPWQARSPPPNTHHQVLL